MLTISKRVGTIRKELKGIILLLEEAIGLLKEYRQNGSDASLEEKCRYLHYFYEYSKRCHTYVKDLRELKPEGIMLDDMIERDLLRNLKLSNQIQETLESMLNELKELQKTLQ